MMKKSVQTLQHKVQNLLTRIQRTGVRKQILFTCSSLMAVMILTVLMLGTISYETMQDYYMSTRVVSDIYTFNDAVDEWESSVADYVLDTTELSRQTCMKHWDQIGTLLNNFIPGDDTSAQLALENLLTVYTYMEVEIGQLLYATDSASRAASYTRLSNQKEALLFLSDQLQRLHTTNTVRSLPSIVSNNILSFAIFGLILILSAILLVVCSRRMIRSICTPIDLLVEDAKKVADGQYDTPDIEIISDDEMGYLSQVFNNMKTQVSANFKNLERIIELQELLQSAELKALQSQINPHFLFNVLSVAEEAALYENADTTVEIIENISYMLQYSLKCTKQDTTLQEELRMVKSYLFLQEQRFGDRIRFTISIPENIPHFLIPGMSLQPIVENAICHGVEKLENGGVVRVEVCAKPLFVEATISDNGYGIAPEILSAIQRGEEVSSKKGPGGIGVANVSRRMEMFFKQRGLFEITSELNHGTTVVLRYPFTESEVSHV